MVQMFRIQIVLCNVKEVNVLLAQDSLIKPFTNSMQVAYKPENQMKQKDHKSCYEILFNCIDVNFNYALIKCIL